MLSVRRCAVRTRNSISQSLWSKRRARSRTSLQAQTTAAAAHGTLAPLDGHAPLGNPSLPSLIALASPARFFVGPTAKRVHKTIEAEVAFRCDHRIEYVSLAGNS